MVTTIGLLDESTNIAQVLVQQYSMPKISSKSPLKIIYFSVLKANVESLSLMSQQLLVLLSVLIYPAPLLCNRVSGIHRKLS